MSFFTKADDSGWVCEEVLTEIFPVRSALGFAIRFAVSGCLNSDSEAVRPYDSIDYLGIG